MIMTTKEQKIVEKKSIENTYTTDSALSITNATEGEKFFIKKKYNGSTMTKNSWLKLFTDERLPHIKFIV